MKNKPPKSPPAQQQNAKAFAASRGSAIRVVELRRRLGEEIREERRKMISSRDGTMVNSGDSYLGRIAALVALGKVYPKTKRESPNDQAQRARGPQDV